MTPDIDAWDAWAPSVLASRLAGVEVPVPPVVPRTAAAGATTGPVAVEPTAAEDTTEV